MKNSPYREDPINSPAVPRINALLNGLMSPLIIKYRFIRKDGELYHSNQTPGCQVHGLPPPVVCRIPFPRPHPVSQVSCGANFIAVGKKCVILFT